MPDPNVRPPAGPETSGAPLSGAAAERARDPLSTPAGAGDVPPGTASLPATPWGLLAALALLVVAFGPVLLETGTRWATDPEYSHGFLLAAVAAWFLWRARGDLRRLGGGASVLAVPLLVLSLVALLLGQLDFMTSLGSYAFVLALAAVVLAYLGWRGLSLVGPALVTLVLACPLPGLVVERLTLPLKHVSAQLAVGLLDVSGIGAYLDGNVIHMPGAERLWVADACSGIRSLISLVSIAVVACLVWKRHWSLKLIVIAAAVPIAVFVNGARIWFTGWLSVHVSPEAASGTFHLLEGFALFAVAGLCLFGFAALLGFLVPGPDR